VNLASVALVSGVAWQIGWMHWVGLPLSAEAKAPYLGYVNGAAVLLGVTGSIVIALFAVPAASGLAARAALLSPARDSEKQEEGLFDKGLLDSLAKILVVLAPALAGVVPGLFEGLGRVGHG